MEDEYLMMVRAPPKRGRANEAVLKPLSKHFGGRAQIVSGLKNRKKVVEIG